MDPRPSPDPGNLPGRLQALAKACAGGLVLASTTLATAPAEASTTSPADRPSITRRVEDLRKQVAASPRADAASEAGPLLAWGNWHNWRNGWPNGWRNWSNWRNFF